MLTWQVEIWSPHQNLTSILLHFSWCYRACHRLDWSGKNGNRMSNGDRRRYRHRWSPKLRKVIRWRRCCTHVW
ncbi:hypothetical protein HanXRQr2_Chr15g0721931 [Helianthus annuus]|uniref:Uncharacterized protein n=1 Tax=Helianthus annuus TaxID=4232 RepID=A0A9K3E6U9_HELAN|nr:hypothetical protein HanXRQr2_Chr15g0721931 [Helianthus annuus]